MPRGICRGKILFINDLVTYESKSPADLQKEFELAVDDYLKTCTNLGRAPAQPFTGLLEVSVSPELHHAAALRAAVDRITLSEVATRALDAYLGDSSDKSA